MFNQELQRTIAAEPIVFEVMAFFPACIDRSILYFEDENPPLTQVVQGLGTFRIRAVAHH
jgi:hypothetical protein